MSSNAYSIESTVKFELRGWDRLKAFLTGKHETGMVITMNVEGPLSTINIHYIHAIESRNLIKKTSAPE